MIKIKIRKLTQLSGEDRFKILLVLVWTRTILTSYAYQTLLRIPFINQFADGIKIFVFIFATLFAMSVIIKRQKLVDIILGIVVVVGYFINIDLFPRTAEYLLNNVVTILCIAFPAYYIGISMCKEEYIDTLHRWSRICLYAIIVYFLVFGFKAEVGRAEAENMGVAYRILPHLVMVMLYAVRKREKIDILLAIIGSVLLLACGTRGPVVGLALFLAVYVVFFYQSKKKWYLVAGLSIVSLLMLVDMRILIDPISLLLEHFGFSTRVVNALLSGELANDNGRNEIAFTMMSMLKANNYHAFGLAGDRNVVLWMAYSHNIILELWITFGLYFGTFVFALICYILIRAVFLANSNEKGFIIALVFGGGFFKLFFTSSFLLEYQFFFLIGYCINIIRKYRKKRIVFNRHENSVLY